jgi:hypothetical protein
MLDLFLLLFACHFLGDFPFQGDWLGINKGKSWELMFYHCAIYAGTFIIFAHVSSLFALILFCSHIIIDPCKARWKFIKCIWFDQILHIGVIVICVLINVVK